MCSEDLQHYLILFSKQNWKLLLSQNPVSYVYVSFASYPSSLSNNFSFSQKFLMTLQLKKHHCFWKLAALASGHLLPHQIQPNVISTKWIRRICTAWLCLGGDNECSTKGLFPQGTELKIKSEFSILSLCVPT